ncbi:hypothetical protein MRX96_058469 [Rhipicephalus microplus]
MWKEELSTLVLPFGTWDLPCCCRRQWYYAVAYYAASTLARSSLASPSYSCHLTQVDVLWRMCFRSTRFSKMPPVPSTNLMFNMPIFQYGLKDRSMGKKEERELPDNESKAIFPPAFLGDRTNQSRCVQALNSYLGSDTTVQASASVAAQ